jgi:hypothetical protein
MFLPAPLSQIVSIVVSRFSFFLTRYILIEYSHFCRLRYFFCWCHPLRILSLVFPFVLLFRIPLSLFIYLFLSVLFPFPSSPFSPPHIHPLTEKPLPWPTKTDYSYAIPGNSDWYSRPYIIFILRKKYSKPYTGCRIGLRDIGFYM